MSHSTIGNGIRRFRIEYGSKNSGGRKKVVSEDQKIIINLEIIMDEDTAGDSMSFLR